LYFWDEMSPDEMRAVIKAQSDKNFEEYKRSWEQVRTVSFFTVVAMGGGKSIRKPEDLFKFSWEKRTKTEEVKLTKDEVEQKAKTMKRKTRKNG